MFFIKSQMFVTNAVVASKHGPEVILEFFADKTALVEPKFM